MAKRSSDSKKKKTSKKKTTRINVKPRTKGQQDYIRTIEQSDITFGIGPAGTGKTYLATSLALQYLISKRVQRIVLVRPAVEAGESLGYLPGDFQEKVNPYMRPIYDALTNHLPVTEVQDYLAREIIEIAPIAYMRGRTLHKAFVILDEAQNTTTKQMLMFLTRLGSKSKAVVTGDASQTDLAHKDNGLNDATLRLEKVNGVSICKLGKDDIVRHKLTQDIIKAYEN